MPFQYQNFRSPLTDSIAARIANQGAIEANRAQQSGQAWAGAIQGAGQAAAAIPGQMQQQQRAAIVDESAALQLGEQKRAIAGRDAFAKIIKDTPQVNEDGVSLYDIPAVAKQLAAAGQDPAIAVDHLGKLNDAFRSEKSAKLALIKTGAAGVAAAGNDPALAAHFLDQLEKNGSYPKDQIQQFRDLIDADPANVAKLTAYLMGPQKMERGAPGSVAVNPMTGMPVPGSEVPEEASKGAYTINGQRFKADGTPMGALVPTQTAPKGFEQKNVTLDGKPNQLVNFDPASGKNFIPGSDQPIDPSRLRANVPPSVVINNANKAGAPGDFTKSGEDFLTSIPVQWRATVKKIANYDEDPTKVASMRGGNREMLMQWVNQVNPGYDASQFTNRAPTRKAFTTGTQGQQINALNTAIGHLDQLIPIAEQLNNSSFVPGNKALNTLSSMFGGAQVTNFETLKDALAGEVASVLSKGQATVSGISAEKEKIKAASSPQQLAGYVKTLIPLMGSKLDALNYQYHQAMGADDAFSALSPDAKTTLAKYGFNPDAHGERNAAASPAGGGTVTMRAPNGQTKQVSAAEVAHYQALGAVVVK